MKLSEIEAITRGLEQGIREFIDKRIADAEARVEVKLERRCAELEGGGVLKFCGTWESGAAYPPGSTVQHDGNLWIAKRVTSEAPGTGDGWQLAVRRGREGKPGRDGKDCPNCRAAS